MMESAKASQLVGNHTMAGGRGEGSHAYPLSLPSLCKTCVSPLFPPSIDSALGVGGSWWGRPVDCAGPEHSSTSTQSEGHVFL